MKLPLLLLLASACISLCLFSCTQPTDPMETPRGRESPGFSEASELLGSISGIAFRDVNRNGLQDDGEPGLGNLVVRLQFGKYPYEMTTRTAAMGFYAFTGLAAGDYTVTLSVPEGGQATTENPILIKLTTTGGEEVGSVDDAHFGLGYIGWVFIEYDFEDGFVPCEWSGTADMEIANGALVLSTDSLTWEWRWHIFDHRLPAGFSRGAYEFKARFGGQGHHFFNIKGHSESDIWDHNFGPFVYIRDGIFRPKEGPVSTITEFEYVPEHWYLVRIEFDNTLGERGRYRLFYQDLTGGGPELEIGEFDYYATNGRLADIAEIGFGVQTYGEVEKAFLVLDDIRLKIWSSVEPTSRPDEKQTDGEIHST